MAKTQKSNLLPDKNKLSEQQQAEIKQLKDALDIVGKNSIFMITFKEKKEYLNIDERKGVAKELTAFNRTIDVLKSVKCKDAESENQRKSLLNLIKTLIKEPKYQDAFVIKTFCDEYLLSAMGGFEAVLDNSLKDKGCGDFDNMLKSHTRVGTSLNIKSISDRKRVKEDAYSIVLNHLDEPHIEVYQQVQICIATLLHFARENRIIKQCEHCGKYFAPDNLHSKYCDGMSPEIAGKTCSQANAHKLKTEYQKEPEYAEYKRITNALNNRIKRAKNNKEKKANEELLKRFKTDWKKSTDRKSLIKEYREEIGKRGK